MCRSSFTAWVENYWRQYKMMPAPFCVHASCFYPLCGCYTIHLIWENEAKNLPFLSTCRRALWDIYRMSCPFAMLGELEPLLVIRLIHFLTLVILDLNTHKQIKTSPLFFFTLIFSYNIVHGLYVHAYTPHHYTDKWTGENTKKSTRINCKKTM